MLKFELKYEAATIGISFSIIIVVGALLNYLANPIWIAICLGTIITVGLIAEVMFFIFLWDFIEAKQKVNILELELELERLKKK